ncbi:Sensory transduction protein LytR [Kordia antarctica]|uniref:Sensory transduction protein LytR n=1 Tax=Kordia antarctica TaxID=1218801 RepID=A0A7L4ZR21_9FLAO|nr:LytTR family DNA-binding domain-containing protein [Kordia antarctica]QHI39138.1 Sensory transduction protein LytR [Kordia antarctica]
MKALIIEDEIPSSRRLARKLADAEVEVVAELSSVRQSIAWLKNNEHPEVFFVDIQLGDGLVFEIFKEVSITSYIIFTTAYDMYALQAFDYKSIAYLLKPITNEKLAEGIAKVKNFQAIPNRMEEIQQLVQYSKETVTKDSFAVKIGRKIKIIKLAEIVCLYSEYNTTFIHTKNDQSFPIDYSLSHLETVLPRQIFNRANRKFILHKTFIKDIISYTNSRLQIKLNNFKEQEIIVSRERVKDFKNWLN